MVKRRSTVWVDVQGRTRAHLLITSAGASAVEAAIAAKSNAAVQLSWEGDLIVATTPVASGAPFPSTRDAAELLFQTGSGVYQKVFVPAPLASIFHADMETVDQAQVSAIIAVVLANVVTTSGSALTAYVSGTRSRQK